MLEYAQKLDEDLAKAIQYVRCLKQDNASAVHFGSTATIASYFLTLHVVSLQTLYPDVHENLGYRFASISAFFELEQLKLKQQLNHFALRGKLYLKALQASFAELQRLGAYHQLIFYHKV